MKWKGRGGLVGAGAMRGAVLVVLAVALQLQLGCSTVVGVGGDSPSTLPIEVFVPAGKGLDVGSVYRLAVRGKVAVDGRAGGASSMLCCEVVEEQVDVRGGTGGNRSLEVECSYGGAAESSGHGVGDLVLGGGACLLVESSLGGDGHGKTQLDSSLALSAFLGWIPRDGSAVAEMQALLHTKAGECSGSQEEKNRFCLLSVTSSIVSLPSIPSSLASVQLERSIYNEMKLSTPREIKATLRLVSKSSPSTGSGSDSARSSIGSAYLRGRSDSIDSNQIRNAQELYHVILSDSREGRGYGGIQDRSARVGYRGRRSLRVSNRSHPL